MRRRGNLCKGAASHHTRRNRSKNMMGHQRLTPGITCLSAPADFCSTLGGYSWFSIDQWLCLLGVACVMKRGTHSSHTATARPNVFFSSRYHIIVEPKFDPMVVPLFACSGRRGPNDVKPRNQRSVSTRNNQTRQMAVFTESRARISSSISSVRSGYGP